MTNFRKSRRGLASLSILYHGRQQAGESSSLQAEPSIGLRGDTVMESNGNPLTAYNGEVGDMPIDGDDLDAAPALPSYLQLPLSGDLDQVRPWHIPHTYDKWQNHTDSTARMYHKSYQLIRNRWNIDPVLAIPSELQERTPYSLALLIVLSRLASHTHHKYEWAQATLQTVVSQRIESDESQRCRTVRTRPDVRGAEDEIVESLDGVMQADVNDAIRVALTLARKSRTLPESSASEQHVESAAKAARSHPQSPAGRTGVRKHRREQKAKKEFKMSRRQSGKLLDFLIARDSLLPDLATDSIDHVEGGDSTQVKSEPDMMEQDELAPRTSLFRRAQHKDPKLMPCSQQSKEDRHDDNLISQWFQRVDVNMDKSQQSRNQRRTFLQGGHSRKKLGINARMPNERFDLGSLPSLHQQIGERKTKEVMERLEGMRLGVKSEKAGRIEEEDDGGGGVSL